MLNNKIYVNGTAIGKGERPYIIAEVGSNFDQSLDKAKKLIDVAVAAGASAVKFQLFRADILYPKKDGHYEAFKAVELNPDWVGTLSDHAGAQKIDFIASPFDRESVDVLESVSVPAYKVASSETTNLPLLGYIASKKKPIFISTGMCEMVDVEEAIKLCVDFENLDISILQCGAMYPLPTKHANLNVIKTFMSRYECPVGFSDHTLDELSAIVAVGIGANVFEKHFTMSKNDKGPDHFYALEPDGLRRYIESIHLAYEALGNREKKFLPDERMYGRREGLYAARDILEGSIVLDSDITVARPALGIRARSISGILGLKIQGNVKKGDPIMWSNFNLKD